MGIPETNSDFQIIGRPDEMIGCCTALGEIARLITLVAPSMVTVLIRGQRGTGKELAATTIHRKSSQCNGPFMAMNAAMLETLVEKELRCNSDKSGPSSAIASLVEKFKAAHDCTFFIDEIAELSLGAQGWLLRAIQENKFQRVPGFGPDEVTIRLIAATSHDLEKEVFNGRFREDLFYRINGFTIATPPLHERGNDILLLADYFVKNYSRLYRKNIKKLSPPIIETFSSYGWPGNVRELKTVLKHAVLVAEDDTLYLHDLPPFIAAENAEFNGRLPQGTLDYMVAAYKKELIVKALNDTQGDLMAAVKLLKTTPRIFRHLVHRFNIDYRKYRNNRNSAIHGDNP